MENDNFFIITEKFAINIKCLTLVYLKSEDGSSRFLGLDYNNAGYDVKLEIKCEDYREAKALYDKVLYQIADYTGQVYEREKHGTQQESK